MQSQVKQQGFSYLFLLLGLTVLALSFLKSQDLVHLRHREQQEEELLFRGDQIRQAIEQYRLAGGGEGSCFPTGFPDLLVDRRGKKVKHHLRQWFPDPFTGKPEWGRLYDPQGRWMGVYSNGEGSPLKKTGFARDAEKFSTASRYREWVFSVPADAAAPLPTACKRP